MWTPWGEMQDWRVLLNWRHAWQTGMTRKSVLGSGWSGPIDWLIDYLHFCTAASLIVMGTNTAMTWSAFLAQEDIAVQHKSQCIPAGGGDRTLVSLIAINNFTSLPPLKRLSRDYRIQSSLPFDDRTNYTATYLSKQMFTEHRTCSNSKAEVLKMYYKLEEIIQKPHQNLWRWGQNIQWWQQCDLTSYGSTRKQAKV